ncbi:Flp pilus assembly protein CpaB [Aeromicrobium sp. A1-2]|uniref:Flp pilus assembly protein CpaB n=1 Tax=Aeromicrobium sp. A1-2 TaxID=2107713 RepID=UPI000E4B21B9|nr:Flp pilus assembly protein CpaB [Aeromicrobium sp. A1-2]AXT86014.1 Flp pilus assembly protein CpaB [Aeromicrobium sp. A1-2]
MNPRQRRGVILMVLAGLCAIALFFVSVNWVGSVNAKVSPLVKTYRATDAIPAYSVIEADDVETVEVPARWVSTSAAVDIKSLVGERVAFNVDEGTYLSDDMLLPRSSLNEDEREIALTVDAKTGIAGRVQTGDFVDVYAVFTNSEGTGGTSRVLVRNVRVVSVRGVETQTAGKGDSFGEEQIIPVTLALQPKAALAVTYADAFATSVRLVGLPPGVTSKNRSNEPESVSGTDLARSGGAS